MCGSSQGLGKSCALALVEAGVSLVINGRDRAKLERTAEEIRQETKVAPPPVAADVGTHEGQAAILDACPEPDILINNSGGPLFRDFRELDRAAMVDGVTMNMITPIEFIQKVIGPMTTRRFGRIVNVTSVSVKMPIAGLDLSSGARAGLTSFLAGVARSVAEHNVTINNVMPGFSTLSVCAKAPSRPRGAPEHLRMPSRRSGPPRLPSAWQPGGVWTGLCLPV